MYQLAPQTCNQLVSLGGTDIHYLDMGSGPPLLLVHGLGQSSLAWHRNVDALTQSHRVIALDLPGFGLSSCPREGAYDPPYYASIIQRFIAALHLRNVDAAGHSAGGLAVLLAASGTPQLFRKLVLVNPAGFTAVSNQMVGDMVLLAVRLWQSMPRNRALIRTAYSAQFHDPAAADEETIGELYSRRGHPASMAAARAAFTAHLDYSRDLSAFHDRLRSLQTRLLIVWGKNDRVFPVKDTLVAQRVLPHARIEWLERCGHCPQLERPNDFNALVQAFLKAS